MIIFRKAVFIIHGFTGNLFDNEYLMNYLELDPKMDVYAYTLPGHSKDRFSNAKVEDWLKFIDDRINTLINNGYKTIYIVGHSMGGILATYAASKYKEIKKIVLVNAAFDYMNLKQNKQDIKDHDLGKYSHLIEKALRTSPFLVLEFTKLVKKSKEYLKKVSCPVLILRSTRDEIVPYKTGELIYNNLNVSKNNVWITDVRDADHCMLSGKRKEVASEYIRKFLKGGRKWKQNIKKEI